MGGLHRDGAQREREGDTVAGVPAIHIADGGRPYAVRSTGAMSTMVNE